jgi:hypothetical protein
MNEILLVQFLKRKSTFFVTLRSDARRARDQRHLFCYVSCLAMTWLCHSFYYPIEHTLKHHHIFYLSKFLKEKKIFTLTFRTIFDAGSFFYIFQRVM